MSEKLLTPEEVAERLRIHHLTVMNYLRAGKIKGHKIGRLWRVKEGDLDAFIEAGQRPTEEAEKGREG